MSDTERLSNSELLRRKATSMHDRARVMMACSIAMEDGELDSEGANDLITRARDPAGIVVQSDHYPGDEYFDRAELELQE